MNKNKRFVSLQRRQGFYGYIFILPLIIGAIAFLIPNIIQTFVFSLNDIQIKEDGYNLIFRGFKFYNDAFFRDTQFVPLLVNSLLTLVTDIPTIVIFSLFISTLLNQKFKGRVFARIVFFVPVLLMAGVIGQIENGTNFINLVESGRSLDSDATTGVQISGITQMISSIDIGKELISIVVIAAEQVYRIVQKSGIQIFVFLAGLQEIPSSLYEAAKVEGCNSWQLFWKVTIPMISAQIIVNSVYTIVDTFTNADNAIFKYFKDVAFNQNKYGYSTAMSFVYLLCIGIILSLFGIIGTRIANKSR